ncbi:MAG: hypothetical protein AB7N91_11925 [Candidatus Tectimicrobiota bacterium]
MNHHSAPGEWLTSIMKSDLVSALLFVGWVVIAARAAWQDRQGRQCRRGIRLFLAYTMLASLAAGVSHREFWPFSRWQIFAYRYQAPIQALQVRAVDAWGREHDVDRRVWEPLSSLDLHTWMLHHLSALSSEQQEVVGQSLLQMVNAARARVVANQHLGVFDRFFGPLYAPLHVVHSPIWRSAADVPPTAFTGLHIYLDRWDVWERFRNPAHIQRTLVYAYRLP